MPAPRDGNFKPAIQGVSSVDLITPVNIAVNPTTHALLIDGSSLGLIGGSTVLVAASDAPDDIKAGATYVCDGTADQTEINTALGAYDSVILSQGTFNINGQILFPSDDLTLTGQGASTVIFCANGVNMNAIFLNGRDNCILRDFTINGNKANNPPDPEELNQNTIRLDQCTNVKLLFLRVLNSAKTGILIVGPSTSCTIYGNFIDESRRNGLYLHWDNNANNVVNANTVNNSETFHGINMSNAQYNSIMGNTCNGNAQNGIDIDGDSIGNVVTGNACAQNGWAGITVRGETGTPLYNVVSSNACSLNFRQGIRIQGGQNTVVTNNSCYDNSQELDNFYSGIRFDNEFGYSVATNNLVMNNRVNVNHSYGIEIMAAGDNNYIAHNYVDGTTAPIYIDGGATGNTLESNYYTSGGVPTLITGQNAPYFVLQSANVVNEAGADVDQRFEGDTDVNLLYLDAGNNRIGVGTASPATKLHTVGEILGEQAGFQVPTISTRITGDANVRFTADNWGILKWSDGTNAVDVNLYRYLPATLKTDGNLNIGGGTVSFEANGTSVTFAGNQYFNAGNRRFNFSLFTGSDDFFLDGDYTAGGTLNIFATNTDDETWYFYRAEAGAKVSVGGGFGAIPSRFTVNDGDAEVVGSANGLVLTSPDATRWRITVSNAGVLSATAI